MNTWVIGHAPFGLYIKAPSYAVDTSVEQPGEKTFFMKARIMAGQADLEGNGFGLQDYKWLTKEEVRGHVGLHYWSYVKNMLSDR
jgi:large subunit ribosomal protein L46